MIRKILKSLLTNKQSHRRSYSSSDFKRKKYGNHHPSKYGHQYYKKKQKSSGFFKSYSS